MCDPGRDLHCLVRDRVTSLRCGHALAGRPSDRIRERRTVELPDRSIATFRSQFSDQVLFVLTQTFSFDEVGSTDFLGILF